MSCKSQRNVDGGDCSRQARPAERERFCSKGERNEGSKSKARIKIKRLRCFARRRRLRAPRSLYQEVCGPESLLCLMPNIPIILMYPMHSCYQHAAPSSSRPHASHQEVHPGNASRTWQALGVRGTHVVSPCSVGAQTVDLGGRDAPLGNGEAMEGAGRPGVCCWLSDMRRAQSFRVCLHFYFHYL